MARLSSTSTGTDITVEPKLCSRPVGELTDPELLAEIEKLRGERGTAVIARQGAGGKRVVLPSAPINPEDLS